MDLQLPIRGRLPQTGPVDAIDRYYDRGIGAVFRQRLAWMCSALPRGELGRLLEIGYGSGVFQYVIARRARLSVGLDIHRAGAAVGRALRADGIRTELVTGDGQCLPFATGAFDIAMLLSALEFMPEPERCLAEALRVVAPDGRVYCMCPRPLRWMDVCYRRLVGFDPEEEFHGGRQRVTVALSQVRARVKRCPRPAWVPPLLAPYEVILLRPVP